MLATALAACLAAGLIRPAVAAAQIQISGQVDLVGMVARDSLALNQAFRGDGPFNPLRLRLFARHWVTDRIGIFTELLYDIDADPRVNGAYVVINELAGRPWLNARLGLAPNIVGGFGLRSTYFNANPLIGVPLVWSYRTNLSAAGTSTASDLLSATAEPARGIPILYDSCWNIQWELLGEVGLFEYSIGFTPGSLSNPVGSRSVEGSTWSARVVHEPLPGLRLGLSSAEGPYLSAPTPGADGTLPYTGDASDFEQGLVGLDVEYQRGRWHFFSELHAVRWETPLVDEDLDVLGGFVEGRFDFLPGWYAAGRVGGLFFGDIVDPTSGAAAPWDRDTHRTEFALGYRLAREVLLKLDWQRTSVPDSDFEQNLFGLQLSAVF